jgi:signal peptidase II
MALDNKKTAYIIFVAVFFIALDRFLKVLAIKNIGSDPVSLLSDFLKFNFNANYNIAFSIPLAGQFLIYLIFFIIIGLIVFFIYLVKKKEYDLWVFAFFVILGSSSNFFDRIKYGFVVDYLDMQLFTVFNIADAMIVFGVGFLFFLELTKKK